MHEPDNRRLTTEHGDYADEEVMLLIHNRDPGEVPAALRLRMRTDPQLRAEVWRGRAESLAMRLALTEPLLEESVGPPVRAHTAGAHRARGLWPALAATLFAVVAGLSGYMAGSGNPRAGLSDEHLVRQTLNQALESSVSGTEVSWQNPDTGTRGQVKPVRTWRSVDGQYCREFSETRRSGDSSSRSRGVACREGPKSWRLQMQIYGA